MPPEAAGSDVPLSIVIVSWNCRDLLLDCLDAVAASRLPPGTEIIVVDNASADGTAAAVRARHPGHLVIANDRNLGFAAANNQGFGRARGRYILLLNPDAFPASPGTFAALLAFLDGHPRFGGAGCRLTHADGSHQVGDAGYRATPGNVLRHALGLTQFLPRGHGLFVVRPGRTGVRAVDWICGACFLIRREVLERVGGLDETFFLYAEDVEWGCRMRAAGIELAYLAGEQVIHLQGGTQGGAAHASVSTRWLDSLAAHYAAINGRRWWPVFRLSLTAGFLARAAAYRLPRRGRREDARKARMMLAFARHVWAMRAASGRPA